MAFTGEANNVILGEFYIKACGRQKLQLKA